MHDLSIKNVKKNIKILENLEKNSSIDVALALKLASMECCGWIEEKMHFILFVYIDAKVKNKILNEEVKNNIKQKNYSFKYNEFRNKIVATIGETEIVKIEGKITKYKNSYFDFEHFKHSLSELKNERDKYAHTYTRSGKKIVTSNSPKLGFAEIKTRIDYVNKGLNIIQKFINRRCKKK